MSEELATVELSREVGGIEMGILSDGTVFLSGRSLARLCGIAPSRVSEHASSWASGKRDGKLAQRLVANGIIGDALHVKTQIPGVAGNVVAAYPEEVCMGFLEHFAFEAGRPEDSIAMKNYRVLARAGLRLFVYKQLGYDPQNQVPPVWREFHDRLGLVSSPAGYFSVFKEMADFTLAIIKGGLRIDAKTVPDISVGQAWSAYWEMKGLSRTHGDRVKHEHNYPEYFPQARSNPQDMWVYPISALGEFKGWLHRTYIPERFPKYLQMKVKAGLLTASAAELFLTEATPPKPKSVPPPAAG